jgi:hypothetical protein
MPRQSLASPNLFPAEFSLPSRDRFECRQVGDSHRPKIPADLDLLCHSYRGLVQMGAVSRDED